VDWGTLVIVDMLGWCGFGNNYNCWYEGL